MDMTLTECLSKVYEYCTPTEDEFGIPLEGDRPDEAYRILRERLNLTDLQAEIFSTILELNFSGRVSASKLAKTLGITRTRLMSYVLEFETLKNAHSLISYNSKKFYSTIFFVPDHIVDSIIRNEAPRPDDYRLATSISRFAEMLRQLFTLFFDDEIDVDYLLEETDLLYKRNRNTNQLVKAFYANLSGSTERLLFSYFLMKAVAHGQKSFDSDDLEMILIDLEEDTNELKKKLERSQLIKEKLVEFGPDGDIRLTDKTLQLIQIGNGRN